MENAIILLVDKVFTENSSLKVKMSLTVKGRLYQDEPALLPCRQCGHYLARTQNTCPSCNTKQRSIFKRFRGLF